MRRAKEGGVMEIAEVGMMRLQARERKRTVKPRKMVRGEL